MVVSICKSFSFSQVDTYINQDYACRGARPGLEGFCVLKSNFPNLVSPRALWDRLVSQACHSKSAICRAGGEAGVGMRHREDWEDTSSGGRIYLTASGSADVTAADSRGLGHCRWRVASSHPGLSQGNAIFPSSCVKSGRKRGEEPTGRGHCERSVSLPASHSGRALGGAGPAAPAAAAVPGLTPGWPDGVSRTGGFRGRQTQVPLPWTQLSLFPLLLSICIRQYSR